MSAVQKKEPINIGLQFGGSSLEYRVSGSTATGTGKNNALERAEQIVGSFAGTNRPVNVNVSWAGQDLRHEHGPDAGLAHPNFNLYAHERKDEDGNSLREARTIEASKTKGFDINKALMLSARSFGANTNNLKIHSANDGAIAAAAFLVKNKLDDEVQSVHQVIGTGSGSTANMGNGELLGLEDGHEVDKRLEEYQALEGPIRTTNKSNVEGGLEAYLSGGPDDKPNIGFKATANYLVSLENNDDIEAALKVLNKSAVEFDWGNLGPGKVTKTDLQAFKEAYNDGREKSNENLLKMSYVMTNFSNNDNARVKKVAHALALHQVRRIIERSIDVVKEQKIEKPKLFSISGGLGESLFKVPGVVQLTSDLLEKSGLGSSRIKLDAKDLELDGIPILMAAKAGMAKAAA